MGNPVRDLAGQTFGCYSVLSFDSIDKYHRARWLCECKFCGSTRVVRGHNLTTAPKNKCPSCTRTTHGQTKEGNITRTYTTWQQMKQRCYNDKHKHFSRYGGRGIEVCDRWKNSFENFLVDMGDRPKNRSIDRIDNDKGYYKENCRWATMEQQNNNRSI